MEDSLKRPGTNHNDLLPWFTEDHGTLPKTYLESCQKFFLELDRRQADKRQAASNKQQATSLPQLCGELTLTKERK